MSNKGVSIAKLSFEDRLHVVEFLRATPGLTRAEAAEKASKHLGIVVSHAVVLSVGKAIKYDFAPTPRSTYKQRGSTQSKDMRTLGRVLNRVVDELGITLTDMQKRELRRIAHYNPTLAEQQQELDLQTNEEDEEAELNDMLNRGYVPKGGSNAHK